MIPAPAKIIFFLPVHHHPVVHSSSNLKPKKSPPESDELWEEDAVVDPCISHTRLQCRFTLHTHMIVLSAGSDKKKAAPKKCHEIRAHGQRLTYVELLLQSGNLRLQICKLLLVDVFLCSLRPAHKRARASFHLGP
jgi:hypothetical protein